MRLGLVIISAALLVSCAAHYNPILRSKLETRASFDLDCKEIQLTPLEETREVITSYGVTGCGKRATYILNIQTESWIQNSGEEAKPTVVR